MSPGLSIEVHFWRGFGPTIQRNLFWYGYRFGFVTVAICKHCVIDRYAALRKTAEAALKQSTRKD